MQYGQQDPYAPPAGGIYSPGGTYAPQPAAGQYVDPAYTASQPQLPQPATYGTPPYAAAPYGQPVMPPPSEPPLPPTPSYDPGYANYLYGLQSSRSSRRYLIQSPTGRKGLFGANNVLTVVIICGTLILVLLAMLLIVTVVMPRLSRKHHAGHRRRHQPSHEVDNLADNEIPVDAPQLSAGSKNEQTEPKLDSAGSKHGHKDPEIARHVKSRTKG
ncbi:uncharacterized protein LOC119406781 [Rhipicephalus sanguineus]|uniref:uncharacterized protein LOC119406781 n=1 Tax=Rhipicephalus sanguineus TaxID=34632 RepID=UPI001895C1DD|nr:uncharacterized protein LOC119406781 [Rhipicephalus sanguineus]